MVEQVSGGNGDNVASSLRSGSLNPAVPHFKRSPRSALMPMPMFQTIKRLLLALAGVLGGAVVGGILSLLLLHLRVAFALGEAFFGLKVLLIFLVCFGAGIVAPRFFMMFFLSPISWLMDSDSSGGGHPSGGSDVDWPNFLSNVSYMVGLVLFVSGVAFSLPWIVGFGLLGISVFTIGVFRRTKKQWRTRRPS